MCVRVCVCECVFLCVCMQAQKLRSLAEGAAGREKGKGKRMRAEKPPCLPGDVRSRGSDGGGPTGSDTESQANQRHMEQTRRGERRLEKVCVCET